MTVKVKEIKQQDILTEVLAGLNQPHKQLPSKLFYDEKGSELFNQICELQEYYPTRTEMQIMVDNINEMSNLLGEGTLLIELGSGNSQKIRLLLEHIPGLAGYIPIDISAEHLKQSAEVLQFEYPHIDIFPLVADYTKDFELPAIDKAYDHNAVYFPGSTIGNFHPKHAKKFLERIANICKPKGGLIIGVDLIKNVQTLEAAYNDEKGITALFNLNMLQHINNEISSDFDQEKFRHFAYFNSELSRIEMHLIVREGHSVKVGDTQIYFEKNENILTECSYKYTIDSFAELASDYFDVKRVWTDEEQLFSIQYLRVK